jgi:hypothetical protein
VKRGIKQSVLVYTGGKRVSGNKVRTAYLRWRAEQKPPIPIRCDNERCQFHTGPLEWLGQSLPLILDHIHGVNSDNRPFNLRLLCPNCDSLNADTRGGANKNRVVKSSGGFGIRRLGVLHYELPADAAAFTTTLPEMATRGTALRKGKK